MTTCNDVQPELVAYHFGTLAPDARESVEVHLLACNECVRAFVALKREIETAQGGERPSPAARARVRASVARELARRRPRQSWSWWERPLAFGFASAAVLLAMLATRALTPENGAMPHALAARETGSPPR